MARKKSKAPLAARAAAAAAPAARSPQVLAGWIISPFWDSILFIGAPLVVIAGFLPLRSVMSSERIAILLLAFFTFGHHFPTFLRSYGDTELFRRFRWRFLLAPPILFCAAMWFNSRDLHGLMLFVAAWDIWHVLMQHYGFMRIYDSKAGAINALTSNLDWAFAISWYLTLIATSPHYSYNLLDRAYASGLPVIDPATVAGTRYGLQVLTALLTLAYIGYHLNLWRLGRPVSLKKLSLMGIFPRRHVLSLCGDRRLSGWLHDLVGISLHSVLRHRLGFQPRPRRASKPGHLVCAFSFPSALEPGDSLHGVDLCLRQLQPLAEPRRQ